MKEDAKLLNSNICIDREKNYIYYSLIRCKTYVFSIYILQNNLTYSQFYE